MAALICAMLATQHLAAGDLLPRPDAKDLVPITHGPNWVDLDGDGHKDLVVKSRWEINGPHSASVYSIHRHLGLNDPFRYEGPDEKGNKLATHVDGEPAWRNNNPGNIKWDGKRDPGFFKDKLGAIGSDGTFVLVFHARCGSLGDQAFR